MRSKPVLAISIDGYGENNTDFFVFLEPQPARILSKILLLWLSPWRLKDYRQMLGNLR